MSDLTPEQEEEFCEPSDFEQEHLDDGPDDFDLRAADEAYADAWQAQWDDDPSPYHGNYSED